jgi:geranylgeranyl diphosphate synthase type I
VSLAESLERTTSLLRPALRAAVESLDDPHMRLIAGYQAGCWDATGAPSDEHGGKRLRGALTLMATEACGAEPEAALSAAVAVELVHNFSLLHDDVMDRDVTRRHQPTGWVVYGESAAILAGTAMLTLAAQLVADMPAAQACLLDATQRLISGQSDDLLLEHRADADLEAVLRMAAGKTAALLSCAAAVGAHAVGAPGGAVAALAEYGFELGMAFQLVDDFLGIVGDPERTGKSASSDLRAGKRTAPIVAALQLGNGAAAHLRDVLADDLADDDAVALAAKLVAEAGGLDWARHEAAARVARACAGLSDAGLSAAGVADLGELARYVLERDR